jgi:aminoglycoside phosphotransferase (APT) family kinase protein
VELQKGPESWVEMQNEAQQRGLATPFQQLWGEAPEWGMRFQVYPLDAHFPNLVRLADPQYARQLSADLGSAASEVWVTPIRYRPGQRHVLRYEPGMRSRGSWVFVKLYPDAEEGSRSFRVANRIVSWLDEHGDGVNGVRPLGYQNADAAIFYPEVSGAPLSRHLRKYGKGVEQNLTLAGRALRSLHASTGLAEELEPVSFADEVRATARAAEHIFPLLPEAGQKISQLLENIQELYGRLPQENPTFTHSDFKSDHLWVSAPGKLTLIDFDTCAYADPAADVGKFLADLHWWFSLYNRPNLENAKRAFLSGYGTGDLKDRMARAKLYEALVLIKITARRVPLFDKNWASRTTELLRQAEYVLAEENLLRSGGK